MPEHVARARIRILGSDDIPPEVKADAARALTIAVTEGALHVPITDRFPLSGIARAEELIESRNRPWSRRARH